MIPTSVSKAFGSFGTSDTSKLLKSFHLETYFHVGRRFGSLGWGGGRPAWGFVPAHSLYFPVTLRCIYWGGLEKGQKEIFKEDFGALNYSPVVSLFGLGLAWYHLWDRCSTCPSPPTDSSLNTNSWTDTFPSVLLEHLLLHFLCSLHQHALIKHSDEPANSAATSWHRLPCESGAQCNLTQTENEILMY